MEATFYIIKASVKHQHNKDFLEPGWAELLLCAEGSHLVFRAGAEGSRPFCPGYGATTFLCNTLSFTDVIHVQIIFGPIVHPPRFQILAGTSDKCIDRAGDMLLRGINENEKQTLPLVYRAHSSWISFYLGLLYRCVICSQWRYKMGTEKEE